MAKYRCAKCGSTALSKCVKQRSIFPDDGMESLMSYLFAVRVDPSESGHRDVVITMHVLNDGVSDVSAMRSAIEEIKVYGAQILTNTCSHDYRLEAGEQCLFGCCES
jgi:hypothetical protein